jgi:hypothetical protein
MDTARDPGSGRLVVGFLLVSSVLVGLTLFFLMRPEGSTPPPSPWVEAQLQQLEGTRDAGATVATASTATITRTATGVP